MWRKSVEEFVKAIQSEEEIIIYDLRVKDAFERDPFPGAVNITIPEIEQMLEEEDYTIFQKDKPIYMICYTGNMSEQFAETLYEEGFDHVYSIDGGYVRYLRSKLMHVMDDEDALEAKALAVEVEAAKLREEGAARRARAESQENGEAIVQEAPVKKKKVLTRNQEIERSIVKKFKKDIWRNFTRAINEYEMIQDGDRIAVCISGGKDSMLMAKLFQELKRHGRNNFDVVYLVMNPGYNQKNYDMIVSNAKLMEIPITVFETEIFDSVKEIDSSPCYLCARMRRGYLYSKAKELGCNKIALGHHFDDVIETIVMGMMYGAQIQTMMPKLHSTNFEGMELIRPLYLVRERDIIHWADYNKLTFIRCACRFTEMVENAQDKEHTSKRREVKELIRQLEQVNPYIPKNIFRSVENVNLATVIAYKKDGQVHHFLDHYEEIDGD